MSRSAIFRLGFQLEQTVVRLTAENARLRKLVVKLNAENSRLHAELYRRRYSGARPVEEE